MLAKGILIPLVKVLDADSSQMSFFEDAILDTIFGVETTNPFERVAQMLSYA